MAEEKNPKWLQEFEEILRKHYPGEEFSEMFEKASELIRLAGKVELPTRESEKIVAPILKLASKELRPLAAVYVGFQLGVAYERYLNANPA